MSASFEIPVLEGMKYYRSIGNNLKGAPPENASHLEALNPEDSVIKVDLMPKEYAYLYA